MNDFRMLSEVTKELQTYLDRYGDIPCLIADKDSANVMCKLEGIYIITLTNTDDNGHTEKFCLFSNLISD